MLTLVWDDLILTGFILRLQVRSYSEVLGVKTPTYLLGGHNSTHKRWLFLLVAEDIATTYSRPEIHLLIY